MPRSISLVGSGKYSDVYRVAERLPPGEGGSGSGSGSGNNCISAGPAMVLKVSCLRGDDPGSPATKFPSVSNLLVFHGVSPHFPVLYDYLECASVPERLVCMLPVERRRSLSRCVGCTLAFLENFDSDLEQYLSLPGTRMDDAIMRSILFSVVYSLACLQKLLGAFRHNDLSVRNILVKRRAVSASYSFGSQKYYIQCPLLVAISDFDFVHVRGHAALSNPRVTSGRYRVDDRRNASYDTHFFLKSLLNRIVAAPEDGIMASTSTATSASSSSPPSVGAVTAAALPEAVRFLRSLQLQEVSRLESEVPSLRPANLLKHPYFQPLTVARSVGAHYSASLRRLAGRLPSRKVS